MSIGVVSAVIILYDEGLPISNMLCIFEDCFEIKTHKI